MIRFLLVSFLLINAVLISAAQSKTNVTPTISPAIFQPSTTITVTYDVTGTALANLPEAWAWVWIPNTSINAKYNFNPASSNATATNNAKFTKSVAAGKTTFSITFKPADFFASDISGQTRMGILLKGNDWANGQTSDYLATFSQGTFEVRFTAPTLKPLFVSNGEEIEIRAEASSSAKIDLYLNGAFVAGVVDATSIAYTHVVTETEGGSEFTVRAVKGSDLDEKTFSYVVSTPSPTAPRPAGIVPGINYGEDNTKATLCLLAPGKTSGYVRGDFSQWDVSAEYLMKRDGEYFWIELTGLVPGQEYGYQYIIDETLFLADPFADKILDPDDQYIPESSYPDLKDFPEEALSENWYFNRVAVLQTAQLPYNWAVTNFQKPAKEKLVIYELLIRDFFGSGERTYKHLTDTLSYLKRLGVNAIELMPIMEFNGNESWGYNPAFMFAPDKYYGTKNDFKAFVDACHQHGMAVILDIAMNHQDLPNPYVMLDFNFSTMKPTASNKWFNTDARHPFNVFFDMNHESAYTKQYLDTVNLYWLREYNIDGYRFDLSKGFTQTNNPSNVGAWSAYDASRIALLKRMADKIWNQFPDAYVILEHLAVNEEEKELAEYRADEGKGMMLWGKMTDQYNQLTMGFSDNSDISGTFYESRTWNNPHLVSYMESHDEERLMFKNIQYGNSEGDYNIRDEAIALRRVAAASTLFYAIPGPKMLWQFGELGYQESINRCENGTINNDCRVSPKPVPWDFLEDQNRINLFDHTSDMIRLRNQYDIFSTSDVSFFTANSSPLVKGLTLKGEPYSASPSNPSQMNVVVVVNFDVRAREVSVPFPHAGTWYDYYRSGMEKSVSNATASVALEPGEYKLFTDVAIESPIITSTGEQSVNDSFLYPNPVGEELHWSGPVDHNTKITLINAFNITVLKRVAPHTWDTARVPSGFYLAKIQTTNSTQYVKIIKR